MKKIIIWTIYALLFFLPWQTRWIFSPAYVRGNFFEYGTRALSGIGVLFILLIIFLLVDWFWKRTFLANLSGQDYSRFELALWLGGLGQGMLAIWQFFSQQVGANKWLGMAEHYAYDSGAFVVEFSNGRWLRAYGAFGSPNSLGIYLAVVLVVGCFLYLREQNYKCKLFFVFGQILITSGMTLSFSRGAWLAALAGIITLFIFSQKEIRKKLFRHLIYLFLILVLFFIIFPQLFLTRLVGVGRLEQKSLHERTAQLAEWKKIESRHWLRGVGYGRYTIELMRARPGLSVYDYNPAHNIYLLMLVELGLPVFLVLVFLFGAGVRFVYVKQPEYLSVAAVWLVAGMFDHWLWTMFAGVLLSLAVGGLICRFTSKNG